ncbi:MAG: cysteine synthase A [Myxococcota bacterium]|nr:cysteine synthase A [Myxococcota bacterium]
MNVANDVSELIGGTPLVRLNRVAEGVSARILAKLELQNPGLSLKDRIGLSMIEDAERDKLIVPGETVLIEPTSGNTGIAIAMIAAIKGYECIIVMPDNMSPEARVTLRAFGTKVVLTEAERDMQGSVEKAIEIAEKTPNAFILQQFRNRSNPAAHRSTTALEIWDDTDGEIDAFVAGVGTGGTITGVAEVIKQRKSSFEVVAVEPAESPVLSGGRPQPHRIQGIGAGFVPEVLARELLDQVITVTADEAIEMSQRLAREEGILCGVSSGANVVAALNYAQQDGNQDKTIVTVVCDSGARYTQTSLFEACRYEGSDDVGV